MARKPGPPAPDMAGKIELAPPPAAPQPDPSRLRSLARLALRLAREDMQASNQPQPPANPPPAGAVG